MSNLSGFDFVCQIRRDKLLDLIQANLTVQGQALVTPFRLVVPGPPIGLPRRRLNAVDLLVKSLDLALDVGANTGTLILRLEAGVIRLPDAPDAILAGGTVNVRLALVDGTFIAVKPLEAKLDTPVTAVIANIPDFAARANAVVNQVLDAERNIDVDCYPDAGVPKQLFVIFNHGRNLDADTFCTFIGQGDPAGLTPSIEFHDSVSLAISSRVIVLALPTAESLSQSHVTITRLTYTFRDGFIDIDGEFDGEDTCWSVDGGTFDQRIFPSLSGQTIAFTPVPVSPNLHFKLDLNFLCVLGAAAVEFLDFTFTQAFYILFGPTFAKALGIKGNFVPPETPTQTQPVYSLGGVVWTTAFITSEGLLFLGDHTGGGIVSPVQVPTVRIRSDEQATAVNVIQGRTTVQGPTCEPADFDYVESSQEDRNTLTVDTAWLFEPIEYAWSIDGAPLAAAGDGVIAVGGDGLSTLAFTGTVKAALPAPNGTLIPGHAVKLFYRALGRTLFLKARPEDLNYDIRVELRATDALGRVFTDAANLTMTGDTVQFGQDYEDYMDRCVKAATDLVNKKGRKQGKVRPGEPQERWKDLLDMVAHQLREGNPEAEVLIPQLMTTVGAKVVGKALMVKLIV